VDKVQTTFCDLSDTIEADIKFNDLCEHNSGKSKKAWRYGVVYFLPYDIDPNARWNRSATCAWEWFDILFISIRTIY